MLEILKLAVTELLSNKVRSVLTSLGILIGVMAVTLILSSGAIANQYLTNELLALTGDIKTIQINPFDPGRREASTIITAQDLEFVESKKNQLPFDNIVPVYSYGLLLKNYKQEEKNQIITGTIPEYTPQLQKMENLSGRFFTDSENQSARNVAVISRDFAKNLYNKTSVLNETITLGKSKFVVIGEFDEKASFGGETETVIIPLKSLWKIDENPKDQLTSIQIVADSQNLVGFVKTELESQLNNYRSSQFSGVQAKPAGFTTSQQSLDTVSSVLTGFQVFLSLVAVISLLVGGIGVLNVMLMSVSQRIREIGIRKALGAKNSDILILFLSESITLTAISGLFGAMLAQYFAYLGVQLLARNGTVLTFEYSWSSVYLAFLLSAVLGTLFGLYPALKASRLSVVDALRFD